MRTLHKVLFICKYDSSVKASLPLASALARSGVKADYFLLHKPSSVMTEQFKSLGLDEQNSTYGEISELFARELYNEYPILHLVLPGHITREFTYYFKDASFKQAGQRPVVIVGLVGLLAANQTDCYISRQIADCIYVGCEKDRDALAQVAEGLGYPADNIFVSGLPIYDKVSHLNLEENRNIILFAAQPTFPTSKKERRYIVEKLIELAETFPEKQVILKPRTKIGESTFHKEKFYLQTFVEEIASQKQMPENFSVSYEPIDQLMKRTDLLLTISSTAALEGLAIGIKVGILADFSITEAYANHFFIGSGLFITFKELLSGQEPVLEPTWLEHNLTADGRNSERIVEEMLRLYNEFTSYQGIVPIRRTFYLDKQCVRDQLMFARETIVAKRTKLRIADRIIDGLITRPITKLLLALRRTKSGERLFMYAIRKATKVYKNSF